jgi:hypothetical protein
VLEGEKISAFEKQEPELALLINHLQRAIFVRKAVNKKRQKIDFSEKKPKKSKEFFEKKI